MQYSKHNAIGNLEISTFGFRILKLNCHRSVDQNKSKISLNSKTEQLKTVQPQGCKIFLDKKPPVKSETLK